MQYKSLSLTALMAATVLLTASCKEEKKEIKTKKGSTIHIIKGENTGDRKYAEGKIITLHLTYRNSKDSVFFTSHTEGKPATGKIMPDSTSDPIAGAFGYLMAGDSADILIPTDSLFKGMMAMQRPPFLPAGSMMKLSVNVKTMESQAELDKRKTKEIEDYIAAHKDSNYVKRPAGTYIAVIKQGTGKVAAPGDSMKVHYRGHLLNSTQVFDESYLSNRPYDFVLKYGNVIPGWHEAFEGIPGGSKVNIIVPYSMGYGEQGSPAIPPYSTLQFECELVRVAAGKAPADVPAMN